MIQIKILESNNKLNLTDQLSKILNNGWDISGQLIITPYFENNENLFWYSILITKNTNNTK
jgi:hypothetical protein